MAVAEVPDAVEAARGGAGRVRTDFPYYGTPFSRSEQAGLGPIQGNIGYGSDANPA
jgi:hypothetical protein